MLDQLRNRFFTRWAELITYRPRLILALAVSLAAISIIITIVGLKFQSNRNDLISDELDWNKRFIDWVERFPGHADLVIVIDTQSTDGIRDATTIRNAEQLIDHLAPKLAALDTIDDVLWGYDPSMADPKTMRLLPMEQFDQRLGQIHDARFLLQSPTPNALAQTIVTQMRTESNTSEEIDEAAVVRDIESLADLIRAFTFRMQHPVDHDMDMMQLLAAGEGLTGWNYLSTDNGRLLFIRMTPKRDADALAPYDVTIARVRSLMAEARKAYPTVGFGLTGIEVIESDETQAFTFDATIASILAAVLIAAVLIIALHGLRVPLMLMVTLGIGIAWSFGFLTLAIGHLQVISVVFTAILLGLGVGFGIHLATRYQRCRLRYDDHEVGFRRAVEDTFRTMGPGVVTGALTTAAAFCTTLLTDFKGVAEMGLIAAAGVMLCMIAMFCVLPVLLRFFNSRHEDVKDIGDESAAHLYSVNWSLPFSRHPTLTIAVASVLTLLSIFAITRMHFDYDLMSLMPEGVPSVEWGQRVIEDGGESVYFGISIVDDMDEARQRAEAFMQLPTVEAVGGIGRIIPTNLETKLSKLSKLQARIQPYLEAIEAEGDYPQTTEADRMQFVAQMQAMPALLYFATQQAPDSLKPALNQVGVSLQTFLQSYSELDAEERRKRLTKLFEDYVAFRSQSAEQIEAVFDPTPIAVDDLPPGLLTGWIAETSNGTRYALEIYPRTPPGASGPLDPAFLGPFIEGMREIDPNVTGVIVQIYESGRLIWTSYLRAGVLALIVVFALVWIDFRSLRDSLLCLVPVAVGFAVTFGVMYLAGMTINPANIIVLPLMFGIGVDAGVHMIHRDRMNPGVRPLGLTSGTGKAISLTSYTTMIGFGSMTIASHRGIVSLGFVMCLGIGMTLIACWTVVPALLELRCRHRERKNSDQPAL